MDTSKYIGRNEGHNLVLGGGGIGSHIIRALLANGATKVSFTYERNKARAEALEAELIAAGYQVKAFHLKEIWSVSEMDSLLDAVVAWAGEEVVAAVNTVAISPNKDLEEQTFESVGDDIDDKGWMDVLKVNTAGNFFALRTIARRMRAKGVKGSLVAISSDNSTVSWSPISTHYDTSKSGVNLSTTKHLAYRFAKDGIRVNAVLPGWTNTDLNKTLPEDERQDALSHIGLGRFAEPEEIARPVAFLLGSGGAFITGAEITVNGGYWR